PSRRISCTRRRAIGSRHTLSRRITFPRRRALGRRFTGGRRARVGSRGGRRRLGLVLIGLVVFAALLSVFVTHTGQHARHHERHQVPDTVATGCRWLSWRRPRARGRAGAGAGVTLAVGVVRFTTAGTEFLRRKLTRSETIGPEGARFGAIRT